MSDDPMPNVQHITSGAAFDALGLAHRVRLPPDKGPHPTLIMVHGLDGNEHVTWVFARSAGPEWLIVTPRAPIPTSSDAADLNFSWYGATTDSFVNGFKTLGRFIDGTLSHYPADPERLVLLGFSQGTVMIFAYALQQPRPRSIAGIAALNGFIAHLNEIEIPPQNGLPVLMIHGLRDERVPVDWARQARDRLRAAGAQVTYEESDIGHKVSSQGMRTLAHWLASFMPQGE